MLQQFIETYGYIAIFLGIMIEGEVALVIGGFSAYLGYLALPVVILAGFLGGFFCDHCYYFIGKWKGREFIEKRPLLKKRVLGVYKFIDKYHDRVIVLFRFAYGFRAIAPFTLGTCDVKLRRFTMLNIVGGLIWSTVWSLGGYFFGSALEIIFGRIKEYEMEAMLSIVLVSVVVWIFWKIKKNRVIKLVEGSNNIAT